MYVIYHVDGALVASYESIESGALYGVCGEGPVDGCATPLTAEEAGDGTCCDWPDCTRIDPL